VIPGRRPISRIPPPLPGGHTVTRSRRNARRRIASFCEAGPFDRLMRPRNRNGAGVGRAGSLGLPASMRPHGLTVELVKNGYAPAGGVQAFTSPKTTQPWPWMRLNQIGPHQQAARLNGYAAVTAALARRAIPLGLNRSTVKPAPALQPCRGLFARMGRVQPHAQRCRKGPKMPRSMRPHSHTVQPLRRCNDCRACPASRFDR
jgi:hypothetical protein